MKRNGIKQVYSAPYHPASNGQAERMVRTFKESLATMKQGDLQIKLDRLLYKYRIMPHSTTGKTPAELMFNREIRTPFHLLQPGSMSTPSVPLNQDQKNSNIYRLSIILLWTHIALFGVLWKHRNTNRHLFAFDIDFHPLPGEHSRTV